MPGGCYGIARSLFLLSHALLGSLVARVLLVSCKVFTRVLLGGCYGTPGGCYVAIRLLCYTSCLLGRSYIIPGCAGVLLCYLR